ncbi:hypothetical protein [Mucilaginibacter pedocola]|nr:hypothetical protein [Mucilaginibacter pedocola]
MKKYIFLAFLLFAGVIQSRAQGKLDSLKQSLQLIENDSLKMPLYAQIADIYLHYDTVANRRRKVYYQNEALNYTMLALHLYSRYSDSTGLRSSFDGLAKVYTSQRKYSEAKWFILQSNGISRIKNDVPNIITSLLKLSMVKMEIRDYKLAMTDLNEALSLSVKNKLPEMEMATQRNYAYLYNRMDEPEKGIAAMKRANLIADNIKKQEAETMAAINRFAGDTISTQKIDSAVKKKAQIVAKKTVKPKASKQPSKKTSKKIVASL